MVIKPPDFRAVCKNGDKGGEVMENAPKYPILLVHGMGFRDNKNIEYWGRIPKALTSIGCRIFHGEQDSNATIETNARAIAQRIDDITRQCGAEKVNIIAHSKGGLDSRYAISTLNMGGKVASLTTICTPHHGSKTVDALMKFPQILVKFVGLCADLCVRLIGDKDPDSYKVFHSLTTSAAEEFNLNNPDDEGVYYQSYAFAMKNPLSDIFMWFPNLVVGIFEGENDGLVTPRSAEWTNFKGIYRGAGNRGVSHCDEVDMRRKKVSIQTKDGVIDIVDIYKNIVRDLIKMGF